ncbi:MAG: hypothetical protein H6617_07885 [Bdellovibrionaceae bacterium]|nr:hypothetical protein [Pseudobdellovibrionaceae bacterium]
MRYAIFCLYTLLCLSAYSQTWIVGEGYVAHTTENDDLEIQNVVTPSWAIEKDSCKVWLGKNESVDASNPDIKTVPFSGKLLSDVENNSVLVSSATSLQRRQLPKGEVLFETLLERPSALVRGLYHENFYWLLYQESRRVWLEQRTQDLELEKSIDLVDGRDVWKAPQILSAGGFLWIGFSVTSNSHAYSPVVTRLDFTGKIQEFFTWPDKGLLFALASLEDRVLASRDIPSAPFTLPVYSHLEELSPGVEPSRFYSAEINWFVDAMATDADGLWTAERSIHSGTGSRLIRQESTNHPKKVWPLPGSVLALCTTR